MHEMAKHHSADPLGPATRFLVPAGPKQGP
jgi:hypothetical protein